MWEELAQETDELNSNIRCIEIFWRQEERQGRRRWIVTLDVLKCGFVPWNTLNAMLNSNIRCIEMVSGFENVSFDDKLNSNIRCIEIPYDLHSSLKGGSWIVTLDVLKLHVICTFSNKRFCWIVTLDVLKYMCKKRTLFTFFVE